MAQATETQISEVEQVLRVVRDWPREKKWLLLRGLINMQEPERKSERLASLQDLVGILRTDGPPPTDEEIEAMRWDRLREKYGPL